MTKSKRLWKRSDRPLLALKYRSAVRRMLREGSVIDADGCWIWQGPRQGEGYAFAHWRPTLENYDLNLTVEQRKLHRLAAWLNDGDAAWSMSALHRCDKKLCVKPRCIYAGTHKQNMADAVRNGRMRGASQPGKLNPMYGRRHSPEVIARARAKVDWGAVVRKAWIKRKQNNVAR